MKNAASSKLQFVVAVFLVIFLVRSGQCSAQSQAKPETAKTPVCLTLSGPPGAGKTTFGKMLSERYGIPHISIGRILRKEIADKTPLGLKAAPYVEKGELVPSDFIMGMIKNRLSQDDCKPGFILDGFPRNMADAKGFDAIVKELKIKNYRMIGLEVSPDLLIERMNNRRVCKNGHEYDIVNNPPKKEGVCDIDRLPVEARSDDTPETIRHRFEVYQKETLPVIEYYSKKGCYKSIEEKSGIDDVFRSIVQIIDNKEK